MGYLEEQSDNKQEAFRSSVHFQVVISSPIPRVSGLKPRSVSSREILTLHLLCLGINQPSPDF